ncbi:MAG: DUF2892 domain-containing protein [Bacteroides sp.]|nr:DUF2892 domain-containing protein [Bacteroides sp.]
MKKNMGTLDKTIRVIIAIAIAILVYTDVITGTLGIVLSIVAIVFLLTSLVGVCPLYMPFGINTCKKEKQA